MIKLKKMINFIQSFWLRILCKKYIKPLKEVKHEKKPLNIILSWDKLNFFAIKKPQNNDPIIETMKLLFINNLKKVAAKEVKRIRA